MFGTEFFKNRSKLADFMKFRIFRKKNRFALKLREIQILSQIFLHNFK